MASAIIVAAGKGLRMNAKVPKQYLKLAGQPILYHTISAINACSLIENIIIVVPKSDIKFCWESIINPLKFRKKVTLVSGGSKRQESVYNGLLLIKDNSDIVVIHDGVRPFVRGDILETCIKEAELYGACITGIPVVETLKKTDINGNICETLERDSVWLARTPQAFKYYLIKKAHENARKKGFSVTDDSSLLEVIGKRVRIIEDDRFNIKITTREDLKYAESII